VLTATVQGRVGNTPFAFVAARLGLWPLWLGALATVVLALRLRRQRSIGSQTRTPSGSWM
jgi:apolipoprotein N-acyltransferase